MKQKISAGLFRLAAALGLGATVFLTGCGEFFTPVNNNPGGTGSTTFVYVTNASLTGGTLSAYSLTSGVLTELTGSPYTLPAIPTSVVVAPNNAFLFVGTTTGVFEYAIASDGTLTEGNNSTVLYISQDSTSTTVQSMVVDSTSSWLIVANQGSSYLDAVNFSPTTGLSSGATIQSAKISQPTAVQLAISPANTNVFVALGVNGIEGIPFTATSTTPWGSTGSVVPVLKTNGSDNAIAIDTTSTYVFVAEATTNQLRSMSIAKLSTETDYATGAGPSAVLPGLDGNYVYVADSTDNTISGYALSAGALTELTDSPFSTTKSPLALVEDSTKGYLLTVGSKGNPNLWLYNFDATILGDLDVKTTTSTGAATTSTANAIAVSH
jgi:6-phosphogluconolactonase (cycloisomerase 2 family)